MWFCLLANHYIESDPEWKWDGWKQFGPFDSEEKLLEWADEVPFTELKYWFQPMKERFKAYPSQTYSEELV